MKHGKMKYLGTITGRFRKGPEPQYITARVRPLWDGSQIPRDVVETDYAALEARLMAHYHDSMPACPWPTYQRRLRGGWWYLGLGRLINDLLMKSPREDRAVAKPEFSVGACLAQEHDLFFMATGALPSELRN